MTALFRKVDCHSIPFADLDAALAFYRDGLGHELIWRDDWAAGLRLPDSMRNWCYTQRSGLSRPTFGCFCPSCDLQICWKRAGRWLQGHSRFESACVP